MKKHRQNNNYKKIKKVGSYAWKSGMRTSEEGRYGKWTRGGIEQTDNPEEYRIREVRVRKRKGH